MRLSDDENSRSAENPRYEDCDYLLGDCNLDGVVNFRDVRLLSNQSGKKEYQD